MLRLPLHRRVLLPTLLALAACAGSSSDSEDDDESFVVKTTKQGVASTTPIHLAGKWLAYLASEASTGAGGTDFNGDLDTSDAIAIRVNTKNGKQTPLNVAVESMAFVGPVLFMAVNEADDGFDWSGDTVLDDRVLLYNEPGDPAVTWLPGALLHPTAARPMVAVGDRLFFVADTPPTVLGDTDLFMTKVTSPPTAPVRVTTGIVDPVNNDGVSVEILDEDDGIVFLTMNEAVDGELNGDGEAFDTTVLAILDGTADGTEVISTGLSVESAADVSALSTGSDWIVAFLVDETDQGTSLNDRGLFDPAWEVPSCLVGLPDLDLTDNVLHWLLYSDFVAGGSVVNTGLVGTPTAGEYVYIHPDEFVGVVSLEDDHGLTACDLNADGDDLDQVFRWVDASDPTADPLPVTDSTKLLALAATIPGAADSTGGVVVVSNLWAVLVDEAAEGNDDHDGDGDDGNNVLLIATHNPSNLGQTWNFDHGTTNPGPVSVTWMADDTRNDDRFLAALSETLAQQDFNGDGDMLDSVPTFPEKVPGSSPPRLAFPGVGFAVDPTNAGIVVAKNTAFYRLSEADEGATDINDDGDANDFLLNRVGLGGGFPVNMGILNNQDTPAGVFALSGVQAGAYIAQETLIGATGKDINGDGDAMDFVVRYFRIE